MQNIFIHTNTDVQFKNNTKDPLAEYNSDLSALKLRFYSTISQKNWDGIRGWMADNNDAFDKSAKVNCNQLGYLCDFRDSGNKVPLGKLSDIYTDIMKGGRTFSIVSSNTAHSMSAPLSRAAFLVHGWSNSKVKLVVNFDYHVDYGSGPESYVVKSRKTDNGAWGQSHVCDDWAGIPDVTYIYAVIGTGSSGNISKIKSLKYKNRKAGQHTSQTYTTNNLNTLVDSHCDIYITIDRDVFTNGRTHFPVKGVLTAGKVETELKTIFAALKPKMINVVGGDITGLPKYKEKSGDKKSFNEAVAEINTLQKYITSFFTP